MQAGQVFIGGTWRPPVSGETYTTINPATEEESARVVEGDERDIDLAVQAAGKAFDAGPWTKMSAAGRGKIVWKLGDLIMAHLDEMARLESLCTGKTLFDSGKPPQVWQTKTASRCEWPQAGQVSGALSGIPT